MRSHEFVPPFFQNQRERERERQLGNRKRKMSHAMWRLHLATGIRSGQTRRIYELSLFLGAVSLSRHVVTVQYDPRWDFRFSFSTGSVGAIRWNLHHARPALSVRKRPLETRRFRAIRSRLRTRKIILKCPSLSRKRRGTGGESALMRRNVAPGNFQGRRFISPRFRANHAR